MVDIVKVMNLLMKNPIPDNIRLFLVNEHGVYVYVNKGKMQMGHRFAGFFAFDRINRGQILDSFSKVEFLINELMRLILVGFDLKKSELFISLISKLSFSARLSVLKKWKIIDKPLEDKWNTLYGQVRNGLAHKFSEEEVTYKDKFLKEPEVLKQFKNDCDNAWTELVQIYRQQEDNIDVESLTNILEEYKQELTNKQQ